MVDINYDVSVVQVTRSLEDLIDKQWITKNEHLRLEAVAHQIVGDLTNLERETEKNKKISAMIDTMHEYFPDLLNKFLEETKESKP